MFKQIKRVAQQTTRAEAPAMVLFGTVTEVSPLTVMVDSRFPLTGPALVPLRPPTGGNAPQFETGDQLALLRNQGGQQYFIIGRA